MTSVTTNLAKPLGWAGAILVAAILCQAQGMSDPASAGIVLGLAGAAIGSIQADTPCGRGCLE